MITPQLRGQAPAMEGKGPEAFSGQISVFAIEAPKTAHLTIEGYLEEEAEENGISPGRFKRLIECESRWREDAAGDNGTSFGILQFKKSTFDYFSKKYGRDDLNVENSFDQIDLASLMIRDGHLPHWKNCARKTGWLASVSQ
jgi:hypothetical protein